MTPKEVSPEDVSVLLKIAYFLTVKALPVRGGEERSIIGYRVPVREFERLRSKVLSLQEKGGVE